MQFETNGFSDLYNIEAYGFVIAILTFVSLS